jgi:hypothetical protein
MKSPFRALARVCLDNNSTRHVANRGTQPKHLRAGVLVAAVAALVLLSSNAQALQISVESLTVFPDNTATGTYTGSGQGTSTWDSALASIVPVDSTPNVVGNSTSAEVQYAYTMSTAAGSSSATFKTLSHYAVTIKVSNDEPGTQVTYAVGVDGLLTGVLSHGGSGALTMSTFSSSEGPIQIGNKAVNDFQGPAIGFPGGTGSYNQAITGTFPNGTGTTYYTIEINRTSTTSANKNGTITVSAGLGPAASASAMMSTQFASPLTNFTNPVDTTSNGQLLTFTATVLTVTVPEPGTWLLLAAGLPVLGVVAFARRKAGC